MQTLLALLARINLPRIVELLKKLIPLLMLGGGAAVAAVAYKAGHGHAPGVCGVSVNTASPLFLGLTLADLVALAGGLFTVVYGAYRGGATGWSLLLIAAKWAAENLLKPKPVPVPAKPEEAVKP